MVSASFGSKELKPAITLSQVGYVAPKPGEDLTYSILHPKKAKKKSLFYLLSPYIRTDTPSR